MYSYGAKLRQYRQRNNLTQKEIAGQIGLTQSNYSRLEKGELDIKLSMILTICKKLHLTANDLIEIGEDED